MTIASPLYMFARTILPAMTIKSPLFELPPMYHGQEMSKNRIERVQLSDTAKHSPNPAEHAPDASLSKFMSYSKQLRSTLPLHMLAIATSKYVLPEFQCRYKNNSANPPPNDNGECKMDSVVKPQKVNDGEGSLKSKLYTLIDWFRNFSKDPLKGKEECQRWMSQKKAKDEGIVAEGAEPPKEAKPRMEAKSAKGAKSAQKAKTKKKVAKEEKGERKAFAGCGWDDDPCDTTNTCFEKKKKGKACVPYCKSEKVKKKESKKKPEESVES